MARAKNTKLLANFDCPGGGQVWVDGTTLYIGHMRQPTGTTIVDVADPRAPQEVGWFIPEPAGGRPAPQSNDVTIDDRGLIYLVDRNVGFDILEHTAG